MYLSLSALSRRLLCNPISCILLIFDMMNPLKNNISEILIESTSGIVPKVLFDDRISFKGHNLIH